MERGDGQDVRGRGLPLSDGRSPVRPGGAADPTARVSPCTRVEVFYLTCLQVAGAHTMAGILAVPAEDDEDGEGAHGTASPDLFHIGDPKTSNSIGEKRNDEVDDFLNSSLSDDKSAATSRTWWQR